MVGFINFRWKLCMLILTITLPMQVNYIYIEILGGPFTDMD